MTRPGAGTGGTAGTVRRDGPGAGTGGTAGTVRRDGPGGPSAFADRVLDVVDTIPPARVMSYGDIAQYLEEGGPRQVGRVMALWGGGVAWWRVIHADGSPPPGHERAALTHYRAEGTPLRSAPARRAPSSSRSRRPPREVPDGPVRVDMALARWRGRH